MASAWLSLGANIGDPPKQLAAALTALNAHRQIKIVRQSSTSITQAWGKTDQNDFHNLAVEIATDLAPENLLTACLSIETKLGRVRAERWGPRLIDIDIIAYEKLQMRTTRLTLPHLHAHERDFVLTPLREISPETADRIISSSKS